MLAQVHREPQVQRPSKTVWWFCLAVICAGLVSAASAQAQSCEDDAGSLVCDADGGADDAGADMAGPVPRASADSGSSSAACSCTSDFKSGEQGRIHVCTGGYESDACASLSCERGTVRGIACSARAVSLCCQMPSRGLYTELYDDCTHPNCEAGFLAQCEDFSGTVTDGPCKLPSGAPADDGSDSGGSLCTVLVVHAAGQHTSPLFALLGLGALFMLRRARVLRRRPRQARIA
jgi:hypothetical protein